MVYRDVHDPETPFPASHFTGRTPHRYDYTFLTPELETRTCEYLGDWLEREGLSGRLSDHAPIEAKFSRVG